MQLDTTAFINQYFSGVWKAKKLTPAGRCSDEEFIRRVSLDVTGRMAPADKVLTFVADNDAAKRTKLVERLLASEEYQEYRSAVWLSLLLPRTVLKTVRAAGDPIHMARPAFVPFPTLYRAQLDLWLTQSEDLNYRQFAEQLITATGKTNEEGAVHFLLGNLGNALPANKAAQDGAFDMIPATLRLARLFLGYRLDGCQFPDHPKAHPDWSAKHFWQLNAFLRQVDRDGNPNINANVFVNSLVLELRDDPKQNARGIVSYESANSTFLPAEATFLDGRQRPSDAWLAALPTASGGAALAALRAREDGKTRRALLADFIVADPQFARAHVNRVWGQLFGRGLHEKPAVDDFGSHNAIVHPEVLDRLARDFVAGGYDTKQLIRWIAASDAYQQRSAANASNADPALDVYFSRMPVRPLSPEQLTLSLRPLASQRQRRLAEQCAFYFSQRFDGNEWEDVPLTDRLIYLLRFLNRKDTETALTEEGGVLSWARKQPDARILDALYLALLNRRPTRQESAAVLAEAVKAKDQAKDLGELWRDVLWALLNSSEFILQH